MIIFLELRFSYYSTDTYTHTYTNTLTRVRIMSIAYPVQLQILIHSRPQSTSVLRYDS